MRNQKIIDEARDRLIKAYDPLAIYLFGSYAWGTPTEDSDLDLLIVVEKSDEKSFKRPIIGQRALFGLGVSKDLIVQTKEEFEKYSQDITTLCYKIKKDGELIYAKS
ncbi:nucleotidyltransferase domain-containing protein [Candidatus Babeliales bacterium]|nr:nucleotidyltransferase domain-containing protein [Candidatus Babeliales bacterium]